jgi:hypothetical protein
MEAAFQLAVKSDGDDSDWCMYLNDALLNTHFFVSDFVLVHGMANAMGETNVNEAHRKLLGDIAPVTNDISTFAFDFVEAIFIKYFGELTATLVAEIKDAPRSRICACRGLWRRRTFFRPSNRPRGCGACRLGRHGPVVGHPVHHAPERPKNRLTAASTILPMARHTKGGSERTVRAQ